jgi:hypothetical protein
MLVPPQSRRASGGTQYATGRHTICHNAATFEEGVTVITVQLFPINAESNGQFRTFHLRYSNQTFLQLRQKLDINGFDHKGIGME